MGCSRGLGKQMNRITYIMIFLGFLAVTNAHAVKETETHVFGAARTAIDPLVVKENTKTGSTLPIFDVDFINVQTTDAQAYVSYAAAASIGSLATSLATLAEGPFSPIFTSGILDVDANGFVVASFTTDDIVFSSAANTMTTVESLLNISGSLFTGTNPASEGAEALATAVVNVNVELSGPGVNFSAFGSRTFSEQNIWGQVQTGPQIFNSGVFVGPVFPSSVSFGSVNVPTNTSLTMSVSLSVNASAALDSGGGDAPFSGSASGDALFGTTVQFPTSGPVFLVDSGITVSSVSASIVNNEWLGTPVSASLVPLPPAGLLIVLPVLAMAGRRIKQVPLTSGTI